MNSESSSEVNAILERIRFLLDPEKIEQEIESPIDRVLESFQCEQPSLFSREAFHRIIGDFLRFLYQEGLRVPKHLSRLEAVAEAIHILDQGYRGHNTTGYEVALCDAADAERKGLRHVIAQIAGLVKETQKQQYALWALGTAPPEYDWRIRVQVVERLMKALSPFLPPSIKERPLSQIASQWRDLLFLYLDTEGALEHYATSALFPRGR